MYINIHNFRKGTNIQYIGPIEAKLLLILHWIIQDAPDECADSDYEKGTFQTGPHYYLYNIPTMTVYIILSFVKYNLNKALKKNNKFIEKLKCVIVVHLFACATI